jgi:hypothetical protein
MLVDFADHRGEKRWLGTGEVVGSVCVENRSVVLDLEEEVFDHALCKLCFSILNEPKDDEVAVPSIHFVEAATRNDVAIGKVEQTFDGDLGDAHIAHVLDPARQMSHRHVALLCECGDRSWWLHSSGEIEYWSGCHFRIDQRFAIDHRARERLPTVVDIA